MSMQPAVTRSTRDNVRHLNGASARYSSVRAHLPPRPLWRHMAQQIKTTFSSTTMAMLTLILVLPIVAGLLLHQQADAWSLEKSLLTGAAMAIFALITPGALAGQRAEQADAPPAVTPPANLQ